MAKSLILIGVYREDRGFYLPEKFVDQIREAAAQREVVQAKNTQELLRLLPDAEVLLTWQPPQEILAKCGHLKWIQSGAAGIERFLIPKIIDSDLILTNSSGIHRIQMAEHTLAMMLAFARQIHLAVRAQIEGRWARKEIWPGMDELCDKTCGIVGYGHVGQGVAARCRAFGMRIIACDLQFPEESLLDGRCSPDELHSLLRASDYVVLAVPATPKTEKMISWDEFRIMKPTAYIINVARGAVIDEEALIRALKAGEIAGAGLDVFEQEPLPDNHPFYQMENVIVFPHLGGSTPRYWERGTDFFCQNLKRYLAGQPLINVIDKRKGY